MNLTQLRRRLWVMYGKRMTEAQMLRIVGRIRSDRPGSGRPRVYSEKDYRHIISYLRVADLCGRDSDDPNRRALQDEAAELLAHYTNGYVWIANNRVNWTPDVPLEAIQSGVTTCWPAWD